MDTGINELTLTFDGPIISPGDGVGDWTVRRALGGAYTSVGLSFFSGNQIGLLMQFDNVDVGTPCEVSYATNGNPIVSTNGSILQNFSDAPCTPVI